MNAKPKKPNYITTSGFKKLTDEYTQLLKVDRPEMVRVVEWAASNGDRSENADYIYGKKRLREIDRRLRFLNKRIDAAEVVDVSKQKHGKVFFGATVTLEDEEGSEFQYQIVGEDEIDTSAGKISWVSPMGRALLGKNPDDEISVSTPAGYKEYILLKIEYK